MWAPAQREDEIEGTGAPGMREQMQPNGQPRAPSSPTSAAAHAATPSAAMAAEPVPRLRAGNDMLPGKDSLPEPQLTPPPRSPFVRPLSHPWGTSAASPPAGWSSSSSLLGSTAAGTAERRRSRRRIADLAGNSGDFEPSRPAFDAPTAPTSASHSSLATGGGGIMVVVGAAAAAATYSTDQLGVASAFDNGGRIRIGAAGAPGCSASKRPRGDDDDGLAAARVDGLGGGGGAQPQPPRRRTRTCPADSTFVSPVKAIVDQDLADVAEDEELELRAWPASRLIFRAGFMKALKGGRAAARRARSATKIRRRTRELHAMLIRHTFHVAHSAQGAAAGEEETDDGERGGNGRVRGMYARKYMYREQVWRCRGAPIGT